MSKRIKTKDSSLEVCLFNGGLIEIESSKFKDVSIQIEIVDSTSPLAPLGALYKIELYKSEERDKIKPFEYDSAWVMKDGTLLKRGREYSEYMKKNRK